MLKQNVWKSFNGFTFDASVMLYSFLSGTEILTINNLLFKAQIDNINLFKVVIKNNHAVVSQNAFSKDSSFSF